MKPRVATPFGRDASPLECSDGFTTGSSAPHPSRHHRPPPRIILAPILVISNDVPEQNRRYIITLASAAVAILVLGALLRPAPIADEPLAPPLSQAELSRLTRITQRRSLEAMKEYFSAVASDADRSVVRLRMLGRSGVVWAPGQVVTARLEPRFPPTTTITGDRGELGVPLVAGGPHLPIVLLDVPETGEFIPVRRRSIENLDPGAWTVFVSDRHGAGFSPATYVEVAEITCQGRTVRDVVTSVALGPELAGAGLFDLDNNLLGVVLPCDGRFVAVTAADIEELTEEAGSVRSRIAQRYGMTLDVVTPAERTHLGVAFGLLVRDVWNGELADTIGLLAGDVVVSINAELILDVDQLAPLVDDAARSGDIEAYELAVVRGSETVVLNLPADPLTLLAPDAAAPDGGLVWDDPDRGYQLNDVRPGTAAALAGLRAGDRLLRLDGAVPDTLAAVRTALSPARETPVLLELERGARRTAILLP